MFIKLLETLNNKKNFPYHFVSILPYAIGDIFEQIKYALDLADKKKKKLIILMPTILPEFLKYKIANKFIFRDCIFNEGLSKNENILKNITNFFLNIEFFFKRIFILIMRDYFKIKFADKHNFPYLGQDHRNINNTLKKKILFKNIMPNNFKKHDLILPKKKLDLCEKIVKSLKIDQKNKNICIHIRDSAYHNDHNRRPYRNPNIKNYIKTINSLCDQGYNVFRIGLVAKEKIQINKKNFYDLPFLLSQDEIEFFQFYLINSSILFIGTESGPQFISWFCNIPTLFTNVARFFYVTAPNQNSRYIFRKFYLKNEKKEISYNEYINLPFIYHNINYVDESVDYIENSSNDIFQATEEMLLNIKKNDWKLTEEQKKFNEKLNSRLETMYHEYDNLKKGNNLIDQWDNINIIKNSISNYGSVCNSMIKE